MTLEELSKLDASGANELLFAYTTDAKRHDKDIEALKGELDMWKSRASLAEGKGLADLAQAARQKAAETEEKLVSIMNSRAEIMRDIQRLKEALPGIKARERSIDPDLLQAELSMMTGEALDPVAAKFETEIAPPADDALAALKRRMGLMPENGGSSASGKN